jgi:hypothetical protein
MKISNMQFLGALLLIAGGLPTAASANDSGLAKGFIGGNARAAASDAPSGDDDSDPPDGIITAQTPDRIVKALENGGFEVEMSKADNGSPLIESTDADNPFSVHFYDCTDGKDCGTIQFVSGWNMKSGISAVTIEQWNSDKIWGQAYRDKDKDPWLAVTVDLRGGVTEANFDDVVGKWADLLDQFAKYIGWTN